jgi:hypothetical protein
MGVKLTAPAFVKNEQQAGFDPGGFAVTNEESDIFNMLLGNRKFPRAACIASGGEFLLTVLMRRAESILAVDHSTRSLTVTYAKLLMLQRVAPTQIIKALWKGDYELVKQQLEVIKELLPKEMQDRLQVSDYTTKQKAVIQDYDLKELRKVWCRTNGLRRLQPKDVKKVTLFQGDLRDVKEKYGTFDLFYASNATEHSGRGVLGKPTYANFAELLNPGGILLFTRSVSSQSVALPKTLHMLDKYQGTATNYMWEYYMAEKLP